MNLDIYKLICNRRSIRRFKQISIPENILIKLVNAAHLAPSAANMQPLEYIILQGDKCHQFFPLLKWAGYIAPKGNPPKGKEPTAYIVILINKNIREKAEKDVGAAAENIIITALSFGIGSCWIDSIEREKAKTLLKIPSNVEVSSTIALGYPDEMPVVESTSDNIKYWKDEKGILHVPKRLLNDILHFGEYGEKHSITPVNNNPYTKISIYFDGASKGNPGKAGIGFVIYDSDKNEILSKAAHIGIATNNEAEYHALIAALKEAIKLSPEKVHIYSDSQLVVKQLNGAYRIKAPHLSKLAIKARKLMAQIPTVQIKHIPREKNTYADKLANAGCKRKD